MTGVFIRNMVVDDIDDVVEIEHQSFSLPWSREAFEAEVCDNDLAVYLIMTSGKQVIGYGGMWIILDEAHVTNIAILPSYRGKGLGKILLNAMIKAAKGQGAQSMTLEVRAGNIVAQKLYAGFGFKNCGVRPGYYTDNREDALIMWLDAM